MRVSCKFGTPDTPAWCVCGSTRRILGVTHVWYLQMAVDLLCLAVLLEEAPQDSLPPHPDDL